MPALAAIIDRSRPRPSLELHSSGGNDSRILACAGQTPVGTMILEKPSSSIALTQE
jgi:hypothetical protein